MEELDVSDGFDVYEYRHGLKLIREDRGTMHLENRAREFTCPATRVAPSAWSGLIGSCVTLYRRAGADWESRMLSHRYFGAMLKIITHDPMRERRGDHPEQNIVSMSIAGIVVGSLMLTVQRAFPPHQVCMTGGAETVAHSFSVRGRRRRRRDDRVLAHLPRGALPVGHRSRGLPLRNSSISSLIGSCVIIFGSGSQYRRFRGLKHLMRDSLPEGDYVSQAVGLGPTTL